MLSHAEAIALVTRIRALDEDAEALYERFRAGVPRPDVERIVWDADLSPAHVASMAIDYETIEVEGMAIPIWRYAPDQRMVRFTDPRRTALHWLPSFAGVIASGESYVDQGFAVSRTPSETRMEGARAAWLEWTGRELGHDVYELAPAWGRPESLLRPARDLPLVAPRSFLLALLATSEREKIGSPGGRFGRG